MKQIMAQHDQAYALRRQIEFVIGDTIDKVKKQLLKLKPYMKYIG